MAKPNTIVDPTKSETNIDLYDLPPHIEKSNGHIPANSPSLTNNPQAQQDVKQEMSKFKIIQNFVTLSFSYLFLFTAYLSMSNLQSSVNHALGTQSLTSIYVGRIFSCLFVPSVMIGLLGEKYTIAVSMFMYCFFLLANFHPRWYTLIPGSVLLGLGGAPLWTAHGSYLTTIAQRYAFHANQPSDTYIVPFFGYFFTIYQTSQIWGNLMTYKILSTAEHEIQLSNHSQCGPLFKEPHGDHTNSTGHSIPAHFNVLCGVFTGCCLMASLVVFVLLDPLHKTAVRVVKKPSLATLFITLRHLKNPHQLLLIPLTIFSGIGQAYMVGDFTKAFVSCGLGVNYVGYVMICYGVTNAVCSCALGIKLNHLGRFIVIIIANSITGAVIILMFLWVPTVNGNSVLYYVISAFWGVGNAVWSTYINAVYGVLFSNEKEAAFSNYRMWQALGFIVSFAYSSLLTIPVKLTILMAFLIAGTAGYCAIEVHLCLARRKSAKVGSTSEQKTSLM